MPWGYAIAAAGTAAAAYANKSSQDKATASAEKGNKRALNAQKEASATQQEALAPWRQSGGQALNKLNQYYGLGGMSGGGQQQAPQFKNEQIEAWMAQNQDHPRYQEVMDKFSPQGRGDTGGMNQPPQAPQGYGLLQQPQGGGIWGQAAQAAQQVQAQNPQATPEQIQQAMAGIF